MKKFFAALAVLVSGFTSHAQQDSIMYQRDSAINVEADCTQDFFLRSERITSIDNIKLVTKTGKVQTMKAFLLANQVENYGTYGLADLNNDGKKELVISNFTGGAHCCDEIYIFRNIATNRYQYVAKTFGGNVCIGKDNRLSFSMYEHFGYFFTCFACAYEAVNDESAQPVHTITLQYINNKLAVVPGDKELKSLILDNLSKLSEEKYQKIDDTGQDMGLRKEFALNLAVYYYSFGRKLSEVQTLFNKYYKFPDAKKVWSVWVKNVQAIGRENGF